EDIAGKVGLKVSFEEQPEEGRYRGKYRTLSDKEHARIVELYSKGLGMQNIAEEMGRSTKTIYDHITKHDLNIAKLGYCPQCRRAKSKFEAAILKQK
ncbi:helix-turn-helix domain-containing protein, partial [Candidatus Bathyarchaeota archaeon]|nr:helix-turn-helix domain-containing protein [Candidatus Bathyarchaeota archaeon]